MKPGPEQALSAPAVSPSSGARVPAAAPAKATVGPTGSVPTTTVSAVTLARPITPTPAATSSYNAVGLPSAGLLLVILALAVFSTNFRIALAACGAQPWLILRLPIIYRRAKSSRVGLAAAIIMHTESRSKNQQEAQGASGAAVARAV